jgi:tetratricopeptide (TPR) repeat protein
MDHGKEQKNHLKILITNHHLLDYTGSEIFTFSLSDFLKRNGHDVTVYSKYVDKMSVHFEKIGIRVVQSIDSISNEKFDVAHVHHNLNAMEVRWFFPDLPIVFLSHGVLPFFEQPPDFNVGISRYLAVSEEVKNNLISKGISGSSIEIFRNIVDEKRFYPALNISPVPRKVLVLSNRLDETKEKIIRNACSKLNIECLFAGERFGEVTNWNLPELINKADIVFSLGRGAIETMMCGRVPIIFDYLGGDGVVTPESVDEIMKCNFSGRRYKFEYTEDDLIKEIKKYDHSAGGQLREFALANFSGTNLINSLIQIYHDVIRRGFRNNLSTSDTKLLNAFVETVRETRNYSYNQWRRTQTKRSEEKEMMVEKIDELLKEAESYIDSKQFSRARVLLNRILKQKPDSVEVLNNIAVIELMNNNYDSAIDVLEKLLNIDPKNEIARNNIEYIRNLGKARQEHDIEIQSEPVEYGNAQLLIADGKYEEAVAMLEKIIEIFPQHASSCNDLGALYFQDGQHDRGIEFIERASRLDPKNVSILKNLCDIYFGLKKYDYALNSARNILKQTPNDTETILLMGDICSAVGQIEEALFFYVRVCELDPGNTKALECLENSRDARFYEFKSLSKSERKQTSYHSISVIVPAICDKSLLVGFLDKLKEQIDSDKDEIIVVNVNEDTNRNDGISSLKQMGIRVLFLPNKFSIVEGVNFASVIATGNHILLVDPNLDIMREWVNGFKFTLSSFPRVTAITGKTITGDGLFVEAGNSAFQNKQLVGRGNGKTIKLPEYNYLEPIDSGSQYFMLVERKDFFEAGGLDPKIVLFNLAMVDLGNELKIKSKTILYQPYCQAKIDYMQDGKEGIENNCQPSKKIIQTLRPKIGKYRSEILSSEVPKKKKVLILGVYLANKLNNIVDIVSVISSTEKFDVTQRWVAIGGHPPIESVNAVTVQQIQERKSKYKILNELIQNEKINDFDFILNVDDDIVLPDGFVDHFIELQSRLDYKIAQPARTRNSFIDHPIVGQQDGVTARATLFVEIGPLVSFHQSIFDIVFPFDLTSSMGWGFENIWAYKLNNHNLKMGIIDAVPVDHSLRKPVEHYAWELANKERETLFSKNNHLPYEECYTVLDTVNE